MRGGKREGSGRKPVEDPRQIKSFTLSRGAIEALKNLEVVMGKDNHSQVIETLLLDAWGKRDEAVKIARPIAQEIAQEIEKAFNRHTQKG